MCDRLLVADTTEVVLIQRCPGEKLPLFLASGSLFSRIMYLSIEKKLLLYTNTANFKFTYSLYLHKIIHIFKGIFNTIIVLSEDTCVLIYNKNRKCIKKIRSLVLLSTLLKCTLFHTNFHR